MCLCVCVCRETHSAHAVKTSLTCCASSHTLSNSNLDLADGQVFFSFNLFIWKITSMKLSLSLSLSLTHSLSHSLTHTHTHIYTCTHTHTSMSLHCLCVCQYRPQRIEPQPCKEHTTIAIWFEWTGPQKQKKENAALSSLLDDC